MTEANSDFEHECFYIAPIGAEGSPERERSDGVLEYVVRPAANELGLTAVRADQIGAPGQITLQVIEHILRARAAVADLTGANPNVYYELAVRHTAKLPVVLIAEHGENLPFDIAQMRTIFLVHTSLKSAAEARVAIAEQLHRGLDGAVDSPIATSVDLQLLGQGNAVERTLADLVTGLEDLVRDVQMNVRVTQRLATQLSPASEIDPDLEILIDWVASHLTDIGDKATKGEMQNRIAELLRVLSNRRRIIHTWQGPVLSPRLGETISRPPPDTLEEAVEEVRRRREAEESAARESKT